MFDAEGLKRLDAMTERKSYLRSVLSPNLSVED